MRLQAVDALAELELRAAVADRKRPSWLNTAMPRPGAEEFLAQWKWMRTASENTLANIWFSIICADMHQRQRVAVIAALVARDVERADHVAVRIEIGVQEQVRNWLAYR